MTKTLPSPKIIIADAPEITQFEAKFVYNFFTSDERGNDSGVLPVEFINKKSSESFDSQFIESNKFNRFAPRYVKFDWKKIPENKKIIPQDVNIKNNLNKIHHEQDFLSQDFTSVVFQDTGIDKKMNFFLRRLLQKQRNYDDPNTPEPFVNESHTDITKLMIEKTSDFLEPSLICESMVNLENEGYVFLDSSNDKINSQNLLKEMTSVKTFGHINSRFLWTIMKSGLEGNLNIFEDEIRDSKDLYSNIEEEAKKNYEPNTINKEDFDIEIQEFVGDPKKINSSGYTTQKQIVGYIIDKTEVDLNGNTINHSPIIIEDPNVSTTIDLKIKYGSTYYYGIRTVVYTEAVVEDVETSEFYIVGYMFSSKNSSFEVVECKEKVPPPSPSDFNVHWDANKKELVLEWSFPINKQRDIKKWQIFRRKNIKEPFELIKVYDFNDSIIKIEDEQTESPNPELIEELYNPLNYYVDMDFKKNKVTGEYPTFIYAVCSVDAHGYSSNYSVQLECTFNRFKNVLLKKMISNSGAPKPFPNFYLLMDTFVDTMSTSNKTKSIKIYFTPEYLNIVNNQNQDLDLLATDKTDRNSLYKINLINLDIQEQENIEIKLKDKIRNDEVVTALLTPSRPKFGIRRKIIRNKI